MWRRKSRPITPLPQSVARVQVPSGTGGDSQSEALGPQPRRLAPSPTPTGPAAPAASLPVHQSRERVETGGRVLLVDDCPERRAVIRTLVQSGAGAGTVVGEAASVAAALTAVRADTVDAAVVEIQMPVPVGLAVIAALRVEQPALVIVVCSFHADAATRQEASAAGADAYLTKPVSARDLLGACALPRRASAVSSDDILSGPDSDSSSGLDLSADHRLVTQGSPP